VPSPAVTKALDLQVTALPEQWIMLQPTKGVFGIFAAFSILPPVILALYKAIVWDGIAKKKLERIEAEDAGEIFVEAEDAPPSTCKKCCWLFLDLGFALIHLFDFASDILYLWTPMANKKIFYSLIAFSILPILGVLIFSIVVTCLSGEQGKCCVFIVTFLGALTNTTTTFNPLFLDEPKENLQVFKLFFGIIYGILEDGP